GNQCGVNTRALLTDMSTPLGRAAGNWLEVKETVACLEPSVLPASRRQNRFNCRQDAGNTLDDLRCLVVECAAHLPVQTSKARSIAAARKQAEDCLNSGAPRKKWDDMLVAQGADLEAFQQKLARDHTAPVVLELRAEESGFVSKCDARLVGEVIRDLGG